MPDMTLETPEAVVDGKAATPDEKTEPIDEPIMDDSFQDHFIIDIGEKKTEAKTKPKTEEVAAEEEKPKDEKPKDEKAKESEEEDEPKGVVKQLRDTVKRLQKKVKEIESGEAKAKPKADEPLPLTDAELDAIYKEHQDDPEVALKVMRYMIAQGSKSATEAQQSITKREGLATRVDSYFGTIFPAYHEEDFAERLNEDFPLDEWELQNHPHAKRLQAALAMSGSFKKMLDEETKKAIEKYKASSLKSETKRTEAIQSRQPATSGKGPVTVLTDRAAQVAKELGLSPSARKIYGGFLSNRGE